MKIHVSSGQLCRLVIGCLMSIAFLLHGQNASDENFLRLNEQSAGQLVYHLVQEEAIPLIFRGVNHENKQWLCENLVTKKKLGSYDSDTIHILPMTEDINEWELTTYALFNISLLSGKRDSMIFNDKLYSTLMIWKAGDRSYKIRKFMDEEKSFISSLENKVKKIEMARTSNLQAKAQEQLTEMFTDSVPQVESLTDKIEGFIGDGDYFAAICLYSRFKSDVLYTVGQLSKRTFFADVNKLFRQWDYAIVEKYTEMRKEKKDREEEFVRICPDESRGVWSLGDPINIRQLQIRCMECFQGFIQARNASALCEFPKWGNGMLSMLSMLSGDSAMPFSSLFDKALKKYKQNMTFGVPVQK